MSVESLAIALHHSRARGAAKLVLIGIANHDGDGGAWPAVATLARYAGVTERNVQKALAALESLGEIRRLVSSGGDHSTADHMKPNLYQFLLRCPSNCDRSARHRPHHDPCEINHGRTCRWGWRGRRGVEQRPRGGCRYRHPNHPLTKPL